MTPEGARWALDVWVPALRSGRYIQGVGTLRQTTEDGDKFCCLGVACDLLPEMVEWVGSDVFYCRDVSDGEYQVMSKLPNVVSRFLGTTSGGWGEGMSCGLSYLNDSGCSFDDIADVIEKHALETLST